MEHIAIDATLTAMLHIVENVDLTEEECEFIDATIQAAVEAALVIHTREILTPSEN